MIRMPLRKSASDKIAIAASKCLFFACERQFDAVPLGSIAQIVSGGTPSTDNPLYWDEDIVWITPKDLGQPHNIEITHSERHISQEGLKSSSAKLLPTGTVLLSSRAPIGHLGIASVPLSTNQGFKNIICSNHLNNKYLFHMLRANIEKFEEQGRGNTFKEIPAKVVAEFLIPLPTIEMQWEIANFLDCVYKRLNHHPIDLPVLSPPLAEQRRIVARIEELAARIEEARGLRREAVDNADKLWIGSLEATFNKLAIKYPEKFFRDVCDVVRGGSPRPAGDPNYYDGDIPFLKVADLTRDSNKYVTTFSATIKEAGLSRSRYVDPGTLMLTNSGATLGVPKICSFGTCFNDGIQAFLNLPENISTEYLYYFFSLKTVWFREWAARGQGQPNLNTDMVKNMSVPIPPITVQKSIIAYLDNIWNQVAIIKRRQAEAAAELDALLPSILDKAFKGEL